MQEITVIALYGCDIYNIAYKNYVLQAFKKALETEASILHLSGGKTNLESNPDTSEVQAALSILDSNPELSDKVREHFMIMENHNAITFRQIVKDLANQYKGESVKINFYCHASHFTKNRYLFSEYRLSQNLVYIGDEELGFNWQDKEHYKQLIALFLEILASKFDWFTKLQLWLRKRKIRRY